MISTHRACQSCGRYAAYLDAKRRNHSGCELCIHSAARVKKHNGHAALPTYHTAPRGVIRKALRSTNADVIYCVVPTTMYAIPMVCISAPPIENAPPSRVTRNMTNATGRKTEERGAECGSGCGVGFAAVR